MDSLRSPIGIRLACWALVLLLLASASPAWAGTQTNPEVTDPPDDAFDPPGPLVQPPPELEVIKAWYTYVDLDVYRLTIEVATFSAWLSNSSYDIAWCIDCNTSDSNRGYLLDVSADGPTRATCTWRDDPQSGPGNVTNIS